MKKTFKKLIAIVMATTTMAVGFGGMSVSAVSETASWSARYVNVHGAPTSERCVILGEYIIDNEATVRSTAKVYGISKSTVHQDVTVRLAKVDPHLAGKVKEVLQKNKDERHIRGGLATKLKYQNGSK